jgi:16S rRNA (cytosine967-C5)-methyltransferase
MAGPDPTREIALHLVQAVLDHHRALEAALDERHDDPRDRAAGHRLAAAVLRRLGTLDAVLEPFLRRAPPIEVRHILRIGAAGLLLLDTPPHAAVATSVALARQRKLDPFTGLVNAVLRRVAGVGTAVLDTLDSPRLDTPPWLWADWGKDARAIATGHQQEAPLDLTLKPGHPAPPDAQMLPTGSARLPAGTRVTELDGYEQGAFWVQDAAAALPVQLLAPRPGETVADLCAAPGGKTAQIAAAGAAAIAIERDPSRLARLRENLTRLRLEATCIAADATTWRPQATVDAVLLDAPCSATGTIRRHPDVPYLKRARDLPFLTDQQDRLLAHAKSMLAPGGRLIYAVCSLQQEEGAARIEAAIASGGWEASPFTEAELAMLPQARTPAGHLRTHPGLWPEWSGLDGFFAARLIRV